MHKASKTKSEVWPIICLEVKFSLLKISLKGSLNKKTWTRY